ncbi:hypothetical protein E1202_06910 [Saccharopolyspora karakumensis]|uniref:Uncharacterized protein n=1 Tax=Saccharopolyspora karakumensis TaxID=2530386 RepID=A0A4R5BUQ0_9PSEU|nr:hypothetical protein [Saccharopolyspora karakumensis]TDD90838.1 hypothetical protein E1202_06910 [Saccharopolyspora karakumensis]
MIDPRREAVLILKRDGQFEDKTSEVTAYRTGEDRTTVTFRGGRSYPYGTDKVRILRDPSVTALDADARVEVDGVVWSSAREILTFRPPEPRRGAGFATRCGERTGSAATRPSG